MIDLRNHYGFTRTPFGKDLAPSMLCHYAAHAEAVARITWCARMPPGSGTGLRDGRAAGRVPADPGRSGAGRRTPARNHRAGRGSGRRPGARERRGGAGRCGPGCPVRPYPACRHAE